MAMKRCPACNNMIANGATVCPHCGKRFTSTATWLFSIIVQRLQNPLWHSWVGA